jgi:hypothetical protein
MKPSERPIDLSKEAQKAPDNAETFAKARSAFLSRVSESPDCDWSFDGKNYHIAVKKTDGLADSWQITVCLEGDKNIAISTESSPNSSVGPKYVLGFKNGAPVERRGMPPFIPPGANGKYMDGFLEELNGILERKIQQFRERLSAVK